MSQYRNDFNNRQNEKDQMEIIRAYCGIYVKRKTENDVGDIINSDMRWTGVSEKDTGDQFE